jgi:hypothetical protein
VANRAERVGILRGAASPADEAVIAEMMQDLGFGIVFQTLEEHLAYTPPSDTDRPVVPLEAIDSPEDFILKEHFDLFKPRERVNQFKTQRRQVASRAFNYLVDTRSSRQLAEGRCWDDQQRRYIDMGQPVPYPGIVACHRSELGFGPYAFNKQIADRARELADFAIQACSFVAVRPQIAEGFATCSAQELTLAMIDQVAEQIAAK